MQLQYKKKEEKSSTGYQQKPKSDVIMFNSCTLIAIPSKKKGK